MCCRSSRKLDVLVRDSPYPAAFTNVAGQLRYSSGVLSADVNGDGIADFEVVVLTQSATNLSLGLNDFIL